MNKLQLLNNYNLKSNDSFGSYIIEPLNLGQSITLGNALRRILLSDLTSFVITGTRINNIKHEFSNIQGIREDILEIILNLKEIIIKNSFLHKNEKNSKFVGYLNAKGPIIITAGLFNLPKEFIHIINPNHYICTITNNSELYIEIDIEKGNNYYSLNNYDNEDNLIYDNSSNTLLIDSTSKPIQKVNFKTKLITDNYGNIKESLYIDITTNGSITPKRAIQESLKILLNMTYPLLLGSNLIKK